MSVFVKLLIKYKIFEIFNIDFLRHYQSIIGLSLFISVVEVKTGGEGQRGLTAHMTLVITLLRTRLGMVIDQFVSIIINIIIFISLYHYNNNNKNKIILVRK